jgi:hypothetical protein
MPASIRSFLRDHPLDSGRTTEEGPPVGLFRNRQSGIAGRARILEMAPTERGVRRADALDVEYRFRLALTGDDGSSFETEYVCKVPHQKMPLPNDTLPVDLDPAAGRVIGIRFDEMPDLAERALASAAAARNGDAAGAAEALGYRLRDPD